MISEIQIGSLKIRVGAFERFTEATAEATTRSIKIMNCSVIDQGAELGGRNFNNEQVELWIRELRSGEVLWRDNSEKIGAFSWERLHINLRLLPAAFQELWAAAEAVDSTERNIQIEYKLSDPTSFSVTNVTLIECMPEKRIHPVVAELKLMGPVTTLVWTAVAFLIILGILRIVRWFIS
jgi:hypothetical protein